MIEFKPFTYHFWDQPYLKSGGSKFGGVFVAFHPFRRLKPAVSELFWKPTNGLLAAEHPDPSCRDEASYEKRYGSEVPWSTVVANCNLEGPHEIVLAHATHFNRLTEQACRLDVLERLSNWCLATGTYFPEEDRIPVKFERKLAQIFRALGINTVVSGHSWFKEWHPVPVDALENREQSYGKIDVSRDCLFTPGHEVVVISLINNVYSLIAVRRDVIGTIDLRSLFEGFWANETTSEEWCNQPAEQMSQLSVPRG